MLREPAVAGQFYPAGKKELSGMIESLRPKEPARLNALGIILPHAGYLYSGKVAVVTVSRVLAKKRLIILGPNHHGAGNTFALSAKGKWRTPFADIAVDTDCAEKILAEGNCITDDPLAHKFEHSIEVALPILYYFFKDFTFVPIAAEPARIELYEKVAAQICAAVKKIKKDVFFVASTDLTHYESDATARKKDREAIEAIINLDAENLVKKVQRKQITMCGLAPVAILIFCLKNLGAKKAQVALYQTSGEASGDYHSVVGYAGITFS